MKPRVLAAVAGAMFGAALTTAALAADITGAGATFPYPIYAKWADTYKAETGTGINYQSIGSGGGVKQIEAGTVTFGASDQPLTKGELDKNGLSQFPMVIGGIVPIVNVEGVTAGQLVLDGPTLADIFQGKITTWNDPRIAALNSGVALPDAGIAVVHRSDGSGTSFNFTNYLSKVSPIWDEELGAASAVEWPAGIGAKGNEGVANTVAQTAGAIGYVEFAYAMQNNLAYTRMVNADGETVAPTIATFQAAAANADWAKTPGYYLILTNQPGAESWPITAATFILVHRQPSDPAAVAEALKFFDWAYAHGDEAAAALHYIPMPDAVVDMVHQTWASEVTANGQPVYAPGEM
jgi:phosphate transport system substrate-binding protein